MIGKGLLLYLFNLFILYTLYTYLSVFGTQEQLHDLSWIRHYFVYICVCFCFVNQVC